MIATLPMYDWPEVRPATDRLWAGIRDRLHAAGIAAPDRLSHHGDMWEDWLRPEMLISQTCGFPFRTKLHGRVTLVGTPDYGLPDAPPGHYYSVLVTRADDAGDWTRFVDRTLAINGYDSQSGWAAPVNHAAAAGLAFSKIIVTGSHRESAHAVAEGRADIAAIDAVTWRLIEAHRPADARRLRVAARTEPTPGLPLIAATGRDPAPLRAAFAAAVAALSPTDRSALGLSGIVVIPAESYLAIPSPEEAPLA